MAAGWPTGRPNRARRKCTSRTSRHRVGSGKSRRVEAALDRRDSHWIVGNPENGAVEPRYAYECDLRQFSNLARDPLFPVEAPRPEFVGHRNRTLLVGSALDILFGKFAGFARMLIAKATG